MATPKFSFADIGLEEEHEVRYGDNKTIHGSGEVNVVLHKGKVVRVWFRCLELPFTQSEDDWTKSKEPKVEGPNMKIKAIVYKDS